MLMTRGQALREGSAEMTRQERAEYLEELSDEFCIPLEAVEALADVLGDSELFDGLVVELEDAYNEGLFA